MNIVLLGAPGVGKGTAASRLAAHFKLPHISTGDVLRANIAEGTELGVNAKKYVDSGKLVPDNIVTEMVKLNLASKKGFFLDGYPRTATQAKALKSFSKIDLVLIFSAPKNTILERLAGRRTCKKCGEVYHTKFVPPQKENVCNKCGADLYQRSDETPKVIMERLAVYEVKTKPLVDFYRSEKILREIDATEDVDGVVKQCIKILES